MIPPRGDNEETINQSINQSANDELKKQATSYSTQPIDRGATVTRGKKIITMLSLTLGVTARQAVMS